MQKITTILSALFLTTQIITAQQTAEHKCSSTEAMRNHFEKHPELKVKFDAAQVALNATINSSFANKTVATANYTIPIVFHILHQNGIENISDAQVIDQVNILNIDYAKKNADTVNTLAVFKPIADSSSIRFVLAKKDPNGNCTSGIIHYLTTDANWNDSSPTLYSQGWDPTKYLNVYVVKSITLSSGFGAAGYTYLPGSWATGAPQDAIVLLHSYTGTIGTSIPFHSHVLTHEVGHWFDLNHVFGWNDCAVDCNNDDFVNDTPQTPGYLSCPTSYSICTPGVPENYQNFMDYSYCETMFTHGQILRMDAAAHSSTAGRNNLFTPANLLATGITPPAVCAPNANFKANKQVICAGQSITFSDLSNVGTPTAWSWNFPGGTPSTSNVQNPIVTYNTPGSYSVQLISSNGAGSSAPEIKTTYISVLGTPLTSTLTESFETATLPNSIWNVTNVSAANTNWMQTSLGAASGSKSAFVSETISPTSVAELISPAYNFSSIPGVALTLKWAGAERNTTTTSSYDVFNVQFSTNCGASWTSYMTRNIKSGSVGVSGIVNGNFNPTPSQFHQEVVTLSSLISSANVIFKLKFTSESGSSNNFYVDDINITSATSLKEQYPTMVNFAVFPNPANEKITISFDLLDDKKVEITLHDILGKKVKTIEKQNLSAKGYML
jgi:PKD repeat protein